MYWQHKIDLNELNAKQAAADSSKALKMCSLYMHCIITCSMLLHCCDIGAFASSKNIHLLLWQYHRMPFPASLLPLMAVCTAHGTAG